MVYADGREEDSSPDQDQSMMDQLIDSISSDTPELRPAAKVLAGVLMDPEFWRSIKEAGPGDRAIMLTALRAAIEQVGKGSPCDICSERASAIRWLVIAPGEGCEGF